MPATINKRVCAELDGPFVVFLIGMRVNRWWKPWAWLPVVRAMPRMLAELARQPHMGLLHARSQFGFPNAMVIQYWRSFEALEAYAKATDAAHLPAWRAFNQRTGSNGDVGIWHETYLVAPGAYESIYNNMPPYGLGLAGRLVDVKGGRHAAHERVKASLGASAAG